MTVVAEKTETIEEYLSSQRELVDAYLEELLPAPPAYPEVLHEAMKYTVFAGGKRIRPILALATGEALGGDFRRLIYLACALEMIHTYTLIHDDLPAMDNDDFRRGIPTAHKKFGEGMAILAGNGLLTYAIQLLTEIPGGAGLATVRLKTIHLICRAAGPSEGVIAGQAADLTAQGNSYSREQLDYIHSTKTGALIEASVQGAALLSGASGEVRRHLKAYASGIGLAFQIVDDILDVVGTSDQLGKASGKDQKEKKATYPALYGLDTSRRIAAELVNDAVQHLAILGSKGTRLRELGWLILSRSQ